MYRSRPWLRMSLGVPAVLAGLLVAASAAESPGPRVLPQGQLPDDRRLGPLVDLNGYFPFTPCPSKEAWSRRAERLRRQLLVALGLWPMPARTPPRAVVHGRIDRGGYSVEKVFFESYPGHFVTGNLYRPTGRSGPLPAVLCPHGHWLNGRFHDHGEKKVREEIAVGAERFEIGGRHPLQARCVQLARMGCVVFLYDMVGRADSVQLDHAPGSRPAMNTPENWGYFSPQAELRLQTMMGLQTYNSIRALDWLLELPDVDPKRVAVTGASGGGTQTFIFCALDPRPAVAFPAVMVSTAMQGGCTCENASYLRVGTGNVEIAALIAPRPLGMTAADDWTKEIAAKGLPELQRLYRLFGAEQRVMAKPLLQFPHNYNYVSREVMYHWLSAHLKLGLPEPILEEDYRPLSPAEMSVWDESHRRPPSGDDYERSLLRRITRESDRQMDALVPRDAASWVKYREVVGGAIDVLVGRRLPAAGEVEVKTLDGSAEHGSQARWQATAAGAEVRPVLLCHRSAGEQVPAIVLMPKNWNRQAVLWISPEGKRSIFAAEDGTRVREPIDRLLKAAVAVVGIDLFGQGEFTADGKPMARNRLNRGTQGEWSGYAGYTYGYNYPLVAQRVHDILSAVSFARNSLKAEKVDVIGLGGAGHWVAAARAQAGAQIDRAAIDTAGFRFARLTAIDDPDFLPGGAKYLDLPGILALSAPSSLWLAGEGLTAPEVVAAAYRAAGEPDALTVSSGAEKERETAAVQWLLSARSK